MGLFSSAYHCEWYHLFDEKQLTRQKPKVHYGSLHGTFFPSPRFSVHWFLELWMFLHYSSYKNNLITLLGHWIKSEFRKDIFIFNVGFTSYSTKPKSSPSEAWVAETTWLQSGHWLKAWEKSSHYKDDTSITVRRVRLYLDFPYF